MKKLTALLLAILMMTVITACGNSEADDNLKDAASTASGVVSDLLNGDYDSDKVESAMDALNSAAQDANAKINMSIAEYVKELKASDDFKQLVQMCQAQYLNIDIVAEGNNLVYKYTYTVEVDVNAVKQALESADNSAMEASANVLHTTLTKLEKVVTEYYTKDGALIGRAEF